MEAQERHYLCTAHTGPYYMYQNLTEAVMMILNLGLQAVVLAQRRMQDNVRTITSTESYMIETACPIISYIYNKKANIQDEVSDYVHITATSGGR